MNKFIAFTLFALVASVNCGPVPEDQEIEAPENHETDLLMGHERLFSDFCNAQGQQIKDDLTNMRNQASSKITEIFFGNMNQITEDVIKVQKEAVEQLTAQLAEPTTEISDKDLPSEDEISKLLKEGKQAIQDSDSVLGVVPATKAAFSAMWSTVNSAVFSRLAKARAAVTGLNLYNGFKSACEKVAAYETAMDAALEEAKKVVLANNPGNAEIEKFVSEVTVTSLNCLTTKNIVRLHGFCDTVQAGHKHFFKMLGMESPLAKFDDNTVVEEEQQEQ